MKNSIHYSEQNTAKAIRVIAALASLGQQTSHSLQSLCFAPCNVIYYLMQIKIVGTEEGPHLWPKRLPLQISMVIT